MRKGILFVFSLLVFLAIFNYALYGSLGLPFGLSSATTSVSTPLACVAQNFFNTIGGPNPYTWTFTPVSSINAGPPPQIGLIPYANYNNGGNWFTAAVANAIAGLYNAIISFANALISGVNGLIAIFWLAAQFMLNGLFQVWDAIGWAVQQMVNAITGALWTAWVFVYNAFIYGINAVFKYLFLGGCYAFNFFAYIYSIFTSLGASLVLLGGGITLIAVVLPYIRVVSSGLGEGGAAILSKLGLYIGLWLILEGLDTHVWYELNLITCNCQIGNNFVGSFGIGTFVFGVLTLVYFASVVMDLLPIG